MTESGRVTTISAKSADTLDALLAHYVSGSLPVPLQTMVAAHLDMRENSRELVGGLEAMAGDELAMMPSDGWRSSDEFFDRIVGSAPPREEPNRPADLPDCDIFPRSMIRLTGCAARDIRWRTKLPGFKEFDLGEIDGCHSSLLWIRPGRAMPTHTHEGSELTLVLDGAFDDTDGHYGRGDIAAADETVEHRPIAAKDRPCICFAVTTAPLKLTGSYAQLFSDIFGR